MAASGWSLLHARIHQTLNDRSLLPKQTALLVAVSGGQDSLCLIRLLLDLQPKWGWRLGMAHCNHRWRSDSDANAAYIQQLAHTWNLPYLSTAAAAPLTSEAAARDWRYQALTKLAQEQGYSYVITGHTASDRAETLLYNLLRGSGSDGLQALTWKRPLTSEIWLVRPLLDLTRAETAQFCQDHQLTIWEDLTNQDPRYRRNRIRQELIPYLKTHFNPQVEQALTQTAELLQAEVEYLETIAQALLKQATANPTNPNQLNRSFLKAQPLALQRRVIRQFLQSILPESPRFSHIEKLVALIAAPNRSQTDPFPGGSIARVEGEWIVVKGMTDES